MKKSLLWIAVGAVVLSLGACSGSGTASTQTSSSSEAQSSAQASSEMTASMSLKDLMMAGTAQKCTVTVNETADTQSTGTIYIAAKKMRGDYATTVSGHSMQTHMIVDGTTAYTWLDGTTMGFKVAMTGQTTSAGGNPNTHMPDTDTKMSYNCAPWAEDDTVFAVPSGITFTQMPGAKTPPAGAVSNAPQAENTACATCGYLTGDQQAKCKASLGCK